MTEDITFCQNGWEECQVTRCERHPSNIKNPQLPHSYAKLYRTEYCPLEKPQPIDVVEVVRCWNCVWWDNCPSSTITPNFHKCKRVGRMSMPSDGFCSYGERKDG